MVCNQIRRRRSAALAVAVAIALLASGCLQKGPAPTEHSVTAETGPFAIATSVVGPGYGFGGGTIYYPTNTSQGTFGAVAVAPGYSATQSSISWYGPRVASQGFVVFTIDTITTADTPVLRGDELLAALDYLTGTSVAKDRVDPQRLAVMGWSMGGGGALFAAKQRPSLKAAIGLAAWSGQDPFSTLRTPTLLVGCEKDFIAEVETNSVAFYDTIPASVPKGYVEIAGGAHECPTTPDATIAREVVSWLKRFVDDDRRYDPFVCPMPTNSSVSRSMSTCPYT